MPEQSVSGHPLAPAWLPVPPDAATLDPVVFTSQYARDASGCVTVDGVPVTELARRHGSPAYVVSERTFRSRARGFREAFERALSPLGVDVAVYYASKALLTSAVARWALAEGLSIDTASGGELAVALAAGVPGERIALHGNNKSAAEITTALRAGVGRIVVDSLAEIELVAALARELGTRAPVMVRVTPGVHASTHEFIATAHEDQKFGFPLPDAEAAVARIREIPGLDFLGLHCHIGSQIFGVAGFRESASRVLELHAALLDGGPVPQMNLGGGFGIAYTRVDDPTPIEVLAGEIVSAVAEGCAARGIALPALSFEPGRAIVGTAGVTVYEVGTTKDVTIASGAVRRYISVDGGMSDNARPALYGAQYSARLASRLGIGAPQLSRVVGKHCESGDIVVDHEYLPGDLTPGDLLAVPVTGAYCVSLSSNYNHVPRPPVVAVRDGRSRVIVRGETIDDLLSRDAGIDGANTPEGEK